MHWPPPKRLSPTPGKRGGRVFFKSLRRLNETNLHRWGMAAPPPRLIAPAGSGKTQTIINRVLHLAKQGARPERILCLTFDNSAMSALREKLTEQLSAVAAPHHKFAISTLNAFGYRLLREHFASEHKPIIEQARIWRLIKELKDALALSAFSARK